MTEFRNELLSRMIHLYGFENEHTINFAMLCERFPDDFLHDTALEECVEAHESEFCGSDDE